MSTQDEMNEAAEQAEQELAALVIDPEDQPSFDQFLEWFGKWWYVAGYKRLGRMLVQLASERGYNAHGR
jgi:hypothetical protein